jgi:hypothetical protein
MLHQGRPTELAQMVLEGEADIAIATESLHNTVSITPTWMATLPRRCAGGCKPKSIALP